MSEALFPTDAFAGEVVYTVQNNVAVIRLNAPDRMNTMGGGINAGVQARLLLRASASAVPAPGSAVVVAGGCATCARPPTLTESHSHLLLR